METRICVREEGPRCSRLRRAGTGSGEDIVGRGGCGNERSGAGGAILRAVLNACGSGGAS